jgi:dipeptidyl aminopeptidase/acylaminoacyl peptidase
MKIMSKAWLLILAISMSIVALAQDAVNYQLPPKEIADLLLAKPTPSVSIDSKGEWMLLSERNSYPTVDELGQPEIRIAGLRLNPNNFSPSRQVYINNFSLKNIKANKEFKVSGLPLNMLASNVRWSPNEKKIVFTNTTANRVDVYIIDVATKVATKVNKQALNIVLGADITWFDNNSILYKVATKPATAAPKKPITPKGPAVQQNIGKAAPGRTYQDLIKTPYDEQLFEFMATCQLVMNKNGIETTIGKPAIYASYEISPDKKYFLVEQLKKPFSYLVPANGFPTEVLVVDLNGKLIKSIADLPSAETRPSGNDNVQNIPRAFQWRDDEPSTLVWCMPLDSGLIKNKVEYHDVIYAYAAPFNTEMKELFKTKTRFRGIAWGDASFAWVNEGLAGKQTLKVSRYNSTTKTLETLFERNTTDAYGNPGSPITTKNSFDKDVILVNGNTILLNNTTGSSPKGDLPFLASFDLTTKKSELLWRCAEGSFEYVVDVLDARGFSFITRKESQREVPNYYIKNIKAKVADVAITNFTNPYPALKGVVKQKVKYTRADGIELTGDLYLPNGYNKDKDGPLPVYMWAYPREFNNAADAAQVRGSENKFTTISWGSPIFYVTQGFAVLDNAEMPIVSSGGDTKPNDNFIDQLKLNAEAAINHLSELGVGDRNRIAVGGHSYGAFMTAHLLSHTNLFKAGIARSGAYNRTLTPFGFQAEDRTYWQAPQLYYTMSPFSYADKIKTPLLLIHGDSDDNPGTFPINSERMFNAVKGHGGTVRFVFLPYEAHSYRGKENLLHMLWEQNEWLKKYVKEAKD